MDLCARKVAKKDGGQPFYFTRGLSRIVPINPYNGTGSLRKFLNCDCQFLVKLFQGDSAEMEKPRADISNLIVRASFYCAATPVQPANRD